MSNSWRKAYKELQDFITCKPDIRIGMNIIAIPGDVRPEFYRLFDAVGTAFVYEKFPDLVSEARSLSENYRRVEQEIIELLDLDDISMMPSLGRFLHDPIGQLVKGLFDLLFDVLKGRIGLEMFEERALRNIEVNFRDLYRLSYEKWVSLSLVKLLEADKSFQVIPQELPYQEEQDVEFKGEVPAPEESKRLLFKSEPNAAFTVPDIMVHSAKVNRYIATRSEIGHALFKASNASEEKEWYSPYSIGVLEPGLVLIYVSDNPKGISLIADVEKICRPDLIIESLEQKDWYETERLEKVKLRYNFLKPRLGTYIVSRELVPEQEPGKQEEDIHILSVGFDQSKLEPIINILMN